MSQFVRTASALVFPLVLTVLADSVAAQVFSSNDMVLLAREDHYAGYNDVWGFVGTDGHEYVIQGTTTDGSAVREVHPRPRQHMARHVRHW